MKLVGVSHDGADLQQNTRALGMERKEPEDHNRQQLSRIGGCGPPVDLILGFWIHFSKVLIIRIFQTA
jgi:hypothetical protein